MATVLPFTPRPEAVPTREAREHDELVAKVTAQLREINVEARRRGLEAGDMLQAVAGVLPTESPNYVKLLHAYLESLGFAGTTAPTWSAK